MIAASEPKTWTDEEFMSLPDDGGRHELVNAEVVEVGNSGMEHGNIGMFLGGTIELYVRSRKLGVTFDSSTAFTLKTGNKRSPDFSFIAKDWLLTLSPI